MNRIILIGNGFDLAHGLQTSYKHFLEDYWDGLYAKLHKCEDCQLSDDFYQFSIMCDAQLYQNEPIGRLFSIFRNNWLMNRTLEQMYSNAIYPTKSYEDLSEVCNAINEQHKADNSPLRIHHQFKSHLFDQINEKTYVEKWVDIENEYYRLLKQIYNGEKKLYSTPKELNEHLKHIEDKLIAYLSAIQQEQIKSDIANNEIKSKIFAPFNTEDISVGGVEHLSNL